MSKPTQTQDDAATVPETADDLATVATASDPGTVAPDIDALAARVEARVAERAAERMYLRTEAERRQAEAQESDFDAATRIRKLNESPGVFKIPIVHPVTENLLGFRWMNGAGDEVDGPADEY